MAKTRNPPTNYTAAFFYEPGNLIFLAAIVLVGALAGSFLPLILGAGLEAILLLLIPGLDVWKDAVEGRLEKAEKEAQGERERRFQRELGYTHAQNIVWMENSLGDISKEIDSKGESVRVVLEETLNAVRRMVATYPRLAREEWALGELKSRSDVKSMEKSLQELKEKVAAAREGEKEQLAAILDQRRAVAERRLAAILRIDDEVAVRRAQLETIRETVSMLLEESSAPRDPARFRFEVDSFLTELDAASAHAGELASMEEEISLDQEVRTRFSA